MRDKGEKFASFPSLKIIVGGGTGLIYAVDNAMGRVNVDYSSVFTVAMLSWDCTVPEWWKTAAA